MKDIKMSILGAVFEPHIIVNLVNEGVGLTSGRSWFHVMVFKNN